MNNIEIISTTLATLKINHNNNIYHIKINTCSIPQINKYKWSLHQHGRNNTNIRIITVVKKKRFYLKHIILGVDLNTQVRLINDDIYDYTVDNLTTQKPRNIYTIEDNHVLLYTTKQEAFYVDKEDLPYTLLHTWSMSSHGYLVASINNDKVYLHRHILNNYYQIIDFNIDHVNHNTNDNRKSNLRIASNSENMVNNHYPKGIVACR